MALLLSYLFSYNLLLDPLLESTWHLNLFFKKPGDNFVAESNIIFITFFKTSRKVNQHLLRIPQHGLEKIRIMTALFNFCLE